LLIIINIVKRLKIRLHESFENSLLTIVIWLVEILPL